MTDGIVLLAFGNPCYGFSAYNMAKSIRYNGCSLPIMLIHDGKQKIDFNVFDHTERIHITECAAYTKMECYFRSVFENTLYLDVDGIALNDITPLFKQFKESGKPYLHYVHTIYSDKDHEYPQMFWATRETIEKYYGNIVKKFPATQSSIQFYRKCDESEKLYQRILDLINEPVPVSEMRNLWGGGQPDELYLNIALAEQGINEMNKDAMFFGNKISPLTLNQIQNKYYFLSMFGGRQFTRSIYQDFYDRYLIKLFQSNNDSHRYKIPMVMNGKHADTNRHIITQLQRAITQQKPYKPRTSKTNEKIHLITTYYKCKSEARQAEVDECLRRNIEDVEIDRITVLTECNIPFIDPKLTIIKVDKRPTFNDCIEFIKDEITIISNSDIYFENANLIKQLNFRDNIFAITRHNMKRGRLVYEGYIGSQDVWIGKGIKPIENNQFFGILRCDQIISYELSKQKKLCNPSKYIKIIHKHEVNERNYTKNDVAIGKGMLVEDSGKGAFRSRALIKPENKQDLKIIKSIYEALTKMNYIIDILVEKGDETYSELYVTPVNKEHDIYDKIIDLSVNENKTDGFVYWWKKNSENVDSKESAILKFYKLNETV